MFGYEEELQDQLIEFAIFLTGHDRETIEQMYADWKKYRKKWNELKNSKDEKV